MTTAPAPLSRRDLLQVGGIGLFGLGVGLAEDLGVLDVIEGGGGDLAVDLLEAEGFEAALAEVDAPDAGLWLGHGTYLHLADHDAPVKDGPDAIGNFTGAAGRLLGEQPGGGEFVGAAILLP